MPHDSLDDVACTAVVQALRTRSTLAGQSTSPERCGATPACADIVLHEKTVLHHVGVGPYLLIGIAGHVGIGEEAVRIANLVASRGPRRAVTVGTADLGEEGLARLEVFGSGVAGRRHSQSAMPDHEVLILLLRHLGIQLLAGQIGLDVACQVARMPLRMFLLRVDAVDILREASLNLRVLRGLLGIVLASEVEIVVAAVRTRHVGDVPDGIGASTVEHRTTTQGIGEAAHILRAITLQAVAVVALPRIGGLIPHGGVERDVRRLGLPLRRDVFVGNGIEQARAIDADGGL